MDFSTIFNRNTKVKKADYCVWRYGEGGIRQYPPNETNFKRIGRTFYSSGYLCPNCKENMLKSNAGEFVEIRTVHGNHKLKSVFMCEKCKTFYSAVAGKMLSDGKYYVLSDATAFNKMLQDIDTYGYSPEQLQGAGW